MIPPIRSVIFTPVNPVTPVRGIEGSRAAEHQVEAVSERPRGQPRPRRNNSGLPAAMVSPAVFDPGNFDTTAAKVDLIEQAGRLLGLDTGDFPTLTAFLDAVAANAPRSGTAEAQALDAGCGMAALGLSIADLLAAMRDPGGPTAAKIDDALRRRVNEAEPHAEAHVSFDEVGRYTA